MSDVNKEIGLYPMSGDVVRFVSTAKLPIGGFETELHPIQDLHGQEYPWPGGGGKNLLNPETVEDGNWFINSQTGELQQPSATGGIWIASDYIAVTPNTSLYFGEINAAATIAGSAWYDDDKQYIIGFTATSLRYSNNKRTVPENAVYLRHSFRIDDGYNTDWENTVYVTIDSNPHAWSPYENICPISGHDSITIYVSPTPEITDETVVHEIEFGETVYSGTLTINEDGSGQIVSNMASVDISNLSATRQVNSQVTGTYYYRVTIPDIAIAKPVLSDVFKYMGKHASTLIKDNSIAVSNSNAYCYIRCDAYGNVDDFKTAMGNSQIVYELAEPITIDLTVEQIETLIGFNYVWNNVGTTNITFQYYTGGEGMAITFLDCWTYPKAKLDEMFKAVNDRLEALEEAAEDADAKTTLIEPKELATEDVAEREGEE